MQNTQIGQWFFKDASHQSSTACSFGLPLPDSVAFHFLGKKSYLIYHLETLIQSVYSFTVNCALIPDGAQLLVQWISFYAFQFLFLAAWHVGS